MQDENREQIRARLLGDEALRASVSLRAYEIYERRGCEPGRELEDWLQSESEILPPLIEEELQRADASSALSFKAPARKLAKKTARLLNGERPAGRP